MWPVWAYFGFFFSSLGPSQFATFSIILEMTMIFFFPKKKTFLVYFSLLEVDGNLEK